LAGCLSFYAAPGNSSQIVAAEEIREKEKEIGMMLERSEVL
jgi:hypothetical protein